MTTEQQERLLGRILMGATIETALDTLGISAGELFAAQENDPAFRDSLSAALSMHDALHRVLGQDSD